MEIIENDYLSANIFIELSRFMYTIIIRTDILNQFLN